MARKAREKPKGLVQRQVDERRKRMLAGVRRHVAKHGVEGSSVHDLAAACRVSVPTLYRTFGSKEALLFEAMQPYAEASLRVSDTTALEGEGYQRLLRVIELWSRGFSAPGDDESRFIQVFLGSEAGQRLAWQASAQLRAEAAKSLHGMRARGELSAWVDVGELAQRLAAQTVVAAIEAASGRSSTRYRSSFVYAASCLMIGASEGEAREAFRQKAVEMQAALDESRRTPRALSESGSER